KFQRIARRRECDAAAPVVCGLRRRGRSKARLLPALVARLELRFDQAEVPKLCPHALLKRPECYRAARDAVNNPFAVTGLVRIKALGR
ncbi:MAG TPA: hypothetical protein VF886_07975, partial [Roseiarcus sp.]